MKRRILYSLMVLALLLGMALPLATPVMAGSASGSVTPSVVANDGTSVLSFTWDIWNWVGTAAYYTFSVHEFGVADHVYIQYSDGAGTDDFPGITVPLQDVAGTEGAPDVHLRNPGHPDTHDWTVPSGFAPGSYNAWALLYLEGETHPTAGAFISFRIVEPDIDLEKWVWDGTDWQNADNPEGPYLLDPDPDPVVFRFVMENTGDADLTDVDLSDTDMVDFYEDFDCTIAATFPTTLDKDEIKTFYGKLAWEPGQHSNTGTVEGFYGTLKVEDEDPAHYFGANPDIDIEKYVWDGTDWQDADGPRGPLLLDPDHVVFRFVIENTGNVDLTGVTISDTHMTGFYTDFGCTTSATFPTTLDKDEIRTFYGKLAWAPGQHANTGTVTGTPPIGPAVTDSDPAHYFGADPDIDIEKYVWDSTNWHDADAPTGPFLLDPDPDLVLFRFVIENTGNVDLTSVNLTDTDISAFFTDQGLTNPAIFPLASLAANATATFYGSLPWSAGQHSNTATAVGAPPIGPHVTDSDPAHYYGSHPRIDLEKAVWDGSTWHDADDPTGPHLPGSVSPVVFRFVITNENNVPLASVNLTDTDISAFFTDQGLTNPAIFPLASLAANATATFYGSLPWSAGQHSNTATAIGRPPVGPNVTDSDPAHYFGSPPSIALEKHVWDSTNWHDADAPTGPHLPNSLNPVIFRFIITNDGGGQLTSVNLTDTDISAFFTDQGLTNPAIFPLASLAENDSVTVYGKVAWQPGQHSNTATAVGAPPIGPNVTDSDPAHYFGSEPPPPIVVGWQGQPVSKLAVLSPMLGLLATIMAGASLLLLRRRRSQA